MRLIADDRVELDAPARRYVPEPMLADEPTAAHVTVLNLLQPPWRIRGLSPSREPSPVSVFAGVVAWTAPPATSPLSGSLTSVSCAGSGDRSVGRRQYLGALIRRGTVGLHHEVLGALVDGLQRRARRDVNHPADGDDLALGRFAEASSGCRRGR